MTRSFRLTRSTSTTPTDTRRRRPGGFALGVVAAVAIAGTLTASAAPPGAGKPANVVPLAPARILDTRTGTGAPAARVGAGQTITLKVAGAGGVPADATGVVLNLTVAGPSEGSFVTAWPTGEPRPNASVINFQGGWDIANMITATLGTNGSIDLYNDRGTVDLIADVAGYLGPAGGAGGSGGKSTGQTIAVGQTKVLATIGADRSIGVTGTCTNTTLEVRITASQKFSVWGQTTASNPTLTTLSRVSGVTTVGLIGAAKDTDGARWQGALINDATSEIFQLDIEIQYSSALGCVVFTLWTPTTRELPAT